MNSKKLREMMATYNQQTDEQKRVTIEAVMAELGHNIDTLVRLAERFRPIYEMAKSLSVDEFNKQLRELCGGDEEKFDAAINMVWLIDNWGLL